MLCLSSYDVVFSEIPGEVTLALNIAGCPLRCVGCHSPHLQTDEGEPLDGPMLHGLLSLYGNSITCVCLMGGDGDACAVNETLSQIKAQSAGRLKTGWYSGSDTIPEQIELEHIDFLKLGPYIEALGGLDKPTTNQRYYRVTDGQLIDTTEIFWS